MTLLDDTVIAVTSRLPDNWLGLRLAILLRRIVTMRLSGDAGVDIERWGLRMRLHPRRNGCEKGLLFTPQMFEVREERTMADQEGSGAAGRTFLFVDIGANIDRFRCSSRLAPGMPQFSRSNPGENPPKVQHRTNRAAPVFICARGKREMCFELIVVTEAVPALRQNTGVANASVSCAMQAVADVLVQEEVQSIDALKIDVEGVEDVVLAPFFRDAPKSLWPRLLIIEDTSNLWEVDLLSELSALGYSVAARTKLNILLRR